jgi:hypothetical protein
MMRQEDEVGGGKVRRPSMTGGAGFLTVAVGLVQSYCLCSVALAINPAPEKPENLAIILSHVKTNETLYQQSNLVNADNAVVEA